MNFFETELKNELWVRSEQARGDLTERKPAASWKDFYHIGVGLASLIPIPGAAAAFMASCKIGQMVMSAMDVCHSFKDTQAGEILLQLKDTVAGLMEWKESFDDTRGVGSAGNVDVLSSSASGTGMLYLINTHLFWCHALVLVELLFFV